MQDGKSFSYEIEKNNSFKEHFIQIHWVFEPKNVQYQLVSIQIDNLT